MTPMESAVLVGSVAAIGWINWYFFAANRQVTAASARQDGLQEVLVRVDGGYSPSAIQVEAGRPVRLRFERADTSGCSEEVVVPAFGIRKFLPTGTVTSVEFTPSEDASTLYDRPLEPVSVYFPVTVKNTSPELAVGMIFGQATNAEQGETDIKFVSDGDIEGLAVAGVAGMPVGESISVKDGWTMTTLEGVEYRVKIDGLAGYSIKFTR